MDVSVSTSALLKLRRAAKESGTVDPELVASFLTELESNLKKLRDQSNDALRQAKR